MRKIFTLMLSLLALCLPAAAQTAQPDVTLTFKGSTATTDGSQTVSQDSFKSNMSSGSDFVKSIVQDKCYVAANSFGIKLGSGSGAGYVTITVSDTYNQREIEQVVVNAASYRTDNSSIKVNSKTTTDAIGTAGTGTNNEFKDMTFTDFTGKLTTLKIETTTKRAYIKSISIYFKPQVSVPDITCFDNNVTISCDTEGADLAYSLDGGETWLTYAGAFEIEETCTVMAKATKEGMSDNTAEKLCEYVAPPVRPSMPVVIIEGDVKTEEEFAVDYGTKITVSSENATSLEVEFTTTGVTETYEGNVHEFVATEAEIFTVTPVNDKMAEGEQTGEPLVFSVEINAPQILSVMNGEEAVENGNPLSAKIGAEISVAAKSYAEITVKNRDLAVEVIDGKFKIGNEGEYVIAASNPAHENPAEWSFTVTHIEETTYEVNETLNWEFTKIVTPSSKDELCNSALENTADSSVGIWTVASEKNCYSSNTNGIQLGSGKSTFLNGTLTLSGSEIPENATISTVSLKGLAANGETFTWGVSVNGKAASNAISFTGTIGQYGIENHIVKSAGNVNIEGNSIVITLNNITTEQKAFYLSGISVSYYVLAEAAAPEFEKPQTISDGTEIVYTVKHGKLHYKIEDAGAAKSPMMRVSEPTADWTVAWEDAGKKFTYTFASGNNHNIYVKNVVNGKEVMGEAINVKEGVVTGVESVAAEGAEGARELYNLQGVRVSEAEAVPGVYVERRGGKVAKVVIR